MENEYAKPDKQKLLDLSKKLYIYSVSAAEYRREVIMSECEHDYRSEIKTKPTPTEEGIMLYTCDKCTHTYEEAIPTSLKILAIGNSFSEDAMAYLYGVLKDAGIENVMIANLKKNGCTLDQHYSYMTDDSAAYTFSTPNPSTGNMVNDSVLRTAKYGIEYDDWDYITIQQGSHHSGVESSFSHLGEIVSYINRYKADHTKIYWHLTWAYQQNSSHSGFANYGNSQSKMYDAIISAVKNTVLQNQDIKGIIPSGTSVQNLRTSVLGDTLTRDGYHLSHGIGRYTAALTWLAAFTDCDISEIDYFPSSYPEVEQYLPHIKDAVKKAIAKPYEVTASAYPAPDTLLNTTLSELNAEDKAYLENNGFSSDGYLSLDISYKENAYYQCNLNTSVNIPASTSSLYNMYLATQIFSKNELVTGSIIRVDSGYRYRPEGWVDMQTVSAERGAETTTDAIVIDDEWWGEYNYRGFNISHNPRSLITEEEGVKFRIYIPIVKRAELTAEDISYLTAAGLNASVYKVLDLKTYLDYYYNSASGWTDYSTLISGKGANTYIATQMLTRYDLTLGSVIRITKSNMKYRPDGWLDLSTRNSSRPANVTTEFVKVDADWWSVYNYRAFNVSASDSSALTAEDASALRIYIKIS